MTGSLTDLYLALGQIPGLVAPYLSALQEALDASGSPTPEAAIREAQAWASRWAESERAGLVFEESAPAWLAALVEGDADPLPDPRPIPVVEEDAGPPADQDPDLEDDPEDLPAPASPARPSYLPPPIPWNGAGAIPERLQVVEGWTDHTLVRRAIADPSVQKAVRERLERISEDLSEIAGIETRLREGAGRLGALTRLSPIDEGRLSKIEGRKRPTPTRGVLEACTRVRALAPELALQATGFRPAPTPEPVSPALDEARALIAAEQAPETPAAPANPRTRAAYLRQLAEESDREASRRRAEADALDPQPAAPAGSGFAAAAAELAAACATLRVETGCGLIREGELPEAIRSALADQARRIEILKVDLTGSNAEIEERDAEIAAAWTALGDAQGATIAEAIRTLLADRDCQIAALRSKATGQGIAIGVRDQEIARLRAELAGRPAAQEPAWHAEGRDLVYSAPPPPVLARVEADLDEPIWHWSVGDTIGRKRGTASSAADARAICDLFLGGGR